MSSVVKNRLKRGKGDPNDYSKLTDQIITIKETTSILHVCTTQNQYTKEVSAKMVPKIPN
jgi:hypothetical protein